jgi:hypothetical protein
VNFRKLPEISGKVRKNSFPEISGKVAVEISGNFGKRSIVSQPYSKS